MSRVWLHLLLLPFTLALALAQSTNDPNRLFERVSPGLLRVEIDLQYSAGEAPTGIIDQDPGAGGPRYFSLAQVVEQANRVIRQIAEQEKYDIVFQDAVYANPRIDITDKVIKALESAKPPAR